MICLHTNVYICMHQEQWMILHKWILLIDMWWCICVFCIRSQVNPTSIAQDSRDATSRYSCRRNLMVEIDAFLQTNSTNLPLWWTMAFLEPRQLLAAFDAVVCPMTCSFIGFGWPGIQVSWWENTLRTLRPDIQKSHVFTTLDSFVCILHRPSAAFLLLFFTCSKCLARV